MYTNTNNYKYYTYEISAHFYLLNSTIVKYIIQRNYMQNVSKSA